MKQWRPYAKFVLDKMWPREDLQRMGWQEAMHEARQGLWRAASTYDPALGIKFNTYAHTVIRNWVETAAYLWRKKSVQFFWNDNREGQGESQVQGGLFPVIDHRGPGPDGLVLEEVRSRVERLPELYRTAIRLYYLEGLTFESMEPHLGVTKETARKRVRMGLEILRGMYQESEVEA